MNELIDLTGKTAVVTGGSRGVGRATAILLARAGASVGIAFRSRQAEAESVVAQLEGLGGRAWAQQGDLTDVADADAYRAYLDVVLEQPATISVLTWGLSDKYSWLQNHFPRADGQMVRSTPYDSEIEKKLAWYAIASAIDNAAPRPTPDP